MNPKNWPLVGCGVGLRTQHYPVITAEWPRMEWFEAISENYMDSGGRPIQILEKVRARYPIALHGTSLSIGSADPLRPQYLSRLKKLVDRVNPFIVSDHLCWSGIGGHELHDLLPLPFTEEAVKHITSRVQHVQEFLGRRILLENVSTYVTYKHSTMEEWEFLSEIVRRSGCGILLDINNLYVNAQNHHLDPHAYLRNLPEEAVGQMHLAGHTDMGAFLFDTHSAAVIDAVWKLYEEALGLFGPVSTLIEWDENIPEFPRLAEEAEKARIIYEQHANTPFLKTGKSAVDSKNRTAAKPAVASSTPSLHDTEAWMKQWVQPQKPPLDVSSPAETLLNPQGGASGTKRMRVYADGYLIRIKEGLAEVYETVKYVLGEEEFANLADEYARTYPSTNYNLNMTGDHLADLLLTHDLSRKYPFLPDLAKLDRLITLAFHAFDEKPFEPARMASVPIDEWENIKIVFQPSVALLSSDWPVLDIWAARDKEKSGDIVPNLRPQSQKILVGRREIQVRCELLDDIQFQLLEGLLRGERLGAVCENIALASKDHPPVAEWFARWVQDGLIARLEGTAPALKQACG